MSITIVTAGDATKLTRDRRFRCVFCDGVFDATSDSYTLIEDVSLRDSLGVEASCTCPTCSKTAYSYQGSSGMVPKITELRVLSLPQKTAYRPGETPDLGGMTIAAVYNDGHFEALLAESCTTAPADALTEEDKFITVTHTASSKTVEIPIRVANEAVALPYIAFGPVPVYTGSAQTIEVVGYDPDKMTRSGDVTKTTAGNYAVQFTPKTGYCWPDGTTGELELVWLIDLAEPITPVLTPAAVTLDAENKTVTFAVTRSGNGVVEAVSSDTTVATAAVSGTTVTVNAPTVEKTGTADIVVTVKEGTNFKAFTRGVTCAVTASFDA